MEKTKSTVENEREDDMIFGILNKPVDFKPKSKKQPQQPIFFRAFGQSQSKILGKRERL